VGVEALPDQQIDLPQIDDAQVDGDLLRLLGLGHDSLPSAPPGATMITILSPAITISMPSRWMVTCAPREGKYAARARCDLPVRELDGSACGLGRHRSCHPVEGAVGAGTPVATMPHAGAVR